MAAPFAADWSGITNALAGYGKGVEEAYQGQTERLIGARLAANDLDGARALAAQRGDLGMNMKLAEFGQHRELFPLQKRQLTAGVEAAEEDLAATRRAREALSNLNGAGPVPTKAGTAGGLQQRTDAPAPMQTFSKFVEDHSLNLNQSDKITAERNWHALLGSHPEIYNDLVAQGFAGNGKPWLDNATGVVNAVRQRLGQPAWAAAQPATAAQPTMTPAPPGSDEQKAQAVQQAAPRVAQVIDTANGKVAVDAANRPLFNLADEYRRAQILMGGGSKQQQLAETHMKLMTTMMDKGIVPTVSGGVAEIPNYQNATGKTSQSEHLMRQELASNPAVKTFEEVRSGYGRVLEGFNAKQPSAIEKKAGTGAGDIAMVYGYMKMLDPTSVVREGEFATAENTGGRVPNALIVTYNKLFTGERLPPQVRTDFLTMSKQLYDRAHSEYEKTAGQYRDIATRAGNNPQNVVIDRRMATPPVDPNAPQAPAYNPGTPQQAPQRQGQAAPDRSLPKILPNQHEAALAEARAAIPTKGIEAVKARLRELGIDPGRL